MEGKALFEENIRAGEANTTEEEKTYSSENVPDKETPSENVVVERIKKIERKAGEVE